MIRSVTLLSFPFFPSIGRRVRVACAFRVEKALARFLYIVAREEPAHYEQLYVWLRRDMADATVELTFDRRHDERRTRAWTVEAERRQGDRRRHHVEEELARVGWARVRIEQDVSA